MHYYWLALVLWFYSAIAGGDKCGRRRTPTERLADADGITIHVTKGFSGELVLTLHDTVRVSALRDRLHDQLIVDKPELLRIQIDLIRGEQRLHDTQVLTQSADLALLIAPVEKIPNKAGDAWAFLAAGMVICEGDASRGGTAPAEVAEGVKEVIATWGAFAALKSDGSVIAWGNWGNEDYGGRVKQVSEVAATLGAFAALKFDGGVIAWGHELLGGRAPAEVAEGVKQVIANAWAFAALKSNGSVIAWGHEGFGGRAPAEVEDVKEVIATSGAFAALKSDGSVIAWGHEDFGGRAPAEVAEGVEEVIATNQGFSALKFDGSEIAWGNQPSERT